MAKTIGIAGIALVIICFVVGSLATLDYLRDDWGYVAAMWGVVGAVTALLAWAAP